MKNKKQKMKNEKLKLKNETPKTKKEKLLLDLYFFHDSNHAQQKYWCARCHIRPCRACYVKFWFPDKKLLFF